MTGLSRNNNSIRKRRHNKKWLEQMGMTICIGAICDVKNRSKENPGPKIILVSDRMISAEDLSIEYEHNLPKIERLLDTCAIASSGDALAHTEFMRDLRKNISHLGPVPRISDIVASMEKQYFDLRNKAFEKEFLWKLGIPSLKEFYGIQNNLAPDIRMGIVAELGKFDYELEILVGGIDDEGAHLYVIEDPGRALVFDDLGCVAIGSGEQHAETSLISSHYLQTIGYQEALYLVYRAKRISEKAPGVGKENIDYWIVTTQGIKEVKENTIDELKQQYENEKAETDKILEKAKTMSVETQKPTQLNGYQ